MSELLAPRCAVCRAPVSLYGETVAYHARAPIGARHAPLGSWMPCEGTGQPPAQERDVRPRAVLDAVAAILDGAEWSSDHLDDIARVLTAAGYVLRPAPQGGGPVGAEDRR